jgi:hypothetical protein
VVEKFNHKSANRVQFVTRYVPRFSLERVKEDTIPPVLAG